MMKEEDSLTVFWPRVAVPEILEVQFCHDFCRRMSRELCAEALSERSWLEYGADEGLERLCLRSRAEMLLVVTDPELVVSASAVRRLADAARSGHGACGPVFNVTAFPGQRAELPAPYFNATTFLEITRLVGEGAGREPAPAEVLDPACVLYRREALLPPAGKPPVRAMAKAITEPGPGVVVRGALVHRFGDYYSGERDDLVRLVPESVKRVLDVGCARGGYGKRLKQVRPAIHLTGVELNPIMAEYARRHYDEVLTCPVEEANLAAGFDLVNCGDLLEHLHDPPRVLAHLRDLLRPRGYLTASVPNVGHWSVVKDLLRGRFEYVPVGLLCISHIRWFTESSLREVLERSGFAIDTFQRDVAPATPGGEAFIRAVCAAGFGDEQSLRTNEFIIRAIKA
jgi:SAM-dependent methyltransferase